MLRADKLACLKIPPVIRNVNVLPSPIPREPFAAVILTPSPVILSPSPVILSGVKNLTQLRVDSVTEESRSRVDFAKNPQALKGMQRQFLLPTQSGVSCNVALRRILTYTDDSSEEQYGCVSILSFLKTFGYVPGGRLHLLRHRTS